MRESKLDIAAMIRPCCAGFEPYVAGKPVETIRRELGLKKVIKLASNENPLGPSPRALAAVRSMLRGVHFYPDSNVWALRRALAEKFGVSPANVILGSGSDEIIELLAKVFFCPSDTIVVSEHAFVRYRMAGDLMGCGVVTVPMKGFAHDLDAMAAAVTATTKAVFIASPNNPTGTYNTAREFARFMRTLEARRTAPLVVVDEAYYEYARLRKDYPETLGYLKKYPNLVILRTFSKVYGLAGLRVGYGFASAPVVDYLDRVRPPFNVNAVAQAAAAACLGDARQVRRSVALVEREKAFLVRELARRDIAAVPSAANFLLIDVTPLTGNEVFRRLLGEGVIVRSMDEYHYPHHVRVTVGLPGENRFFVRKLGKIMKEA